MNAVKNRDKVSSRMPDIVVDTGVATRRLPVYLLLDTSGSMAGAPIDAVRRGMEQFKREVGEDKFARETVHVGVISYGGEAQCLTEGLIPIDGFEVPRLSASGQTPLGQALWLLIESLDKDIRSAVEAGEEGDWKPVVFILTGGEPTDEWREPHQEILNRQHNKVVNVTTVGCGLDVNEQNLKEIAIGPTFKIDSDEESLSRFFDWVSQSVIVASNSSFTCPLPEKYYFYLNSVCLP